MPAQVTARNLEILLCLFCSLAVLDPTVGHTTEVLSV